MNEKISQTLEVFNETSEGLTDWDKLKDSDSPAKNTELDITEIMDSVKVPEIEFDDEPNAAETPAEYLATNQEIYNEMFNHLNNDVHTAERNQASPETIAEAKSSRDLLIDAYLETTVNTKEGEPATSLIDALTKRQAICDQKTEIYLKLGDNQTAKRNHELSKLTSTLIGHANTIKHNIENSKNPNSSYNKLADAFHSGPTPQNNSEALPIDSIV